MLELIPPQLKFFPAYMDFVEHGLNKNLEELGGHIGYEVKPSCRRRGYATAMLKQLLARPETRGLGKVLLTCAPNNLGSNKAIQPAEEF